MCTFTLSPAEDAVLDIEAAKYVRPGQPFIDAQCRAFDARVSRWLKVVREQAFRDGKKIRGATKVFRVAEAHDSEQTSALKRGRPHFHMLLHEKEVGSLISDTDCEWVQERNKQGELVWLYRVKDDCPVRTAWPFGWSKIVLCFSEESAYYLCKYLHKKPIYRVKAGIGYYDRRKDSGESPTEHPGGCAPERAGSIVPPNVA